MTPGAKQDEGLYTPGAEHFPLRLESIKPHLTMVEKRRTTPKSHYCCLTSAQYNSGPTRRAKIRASPRTRVFTTSLYQLMFVLGVAEWREKIPERFEAEPIPNRRNQGARSAGAGFGVLLIVFICFCV